MNNDRMQRFIHMVWKLALLVSLAALTALCPVWAEDEEAGSDPMDFVLLLDCSDSMSKSDPEYLNLSAARMFIDMLPAENARLSVIAFGPDYGDEAYTELTFVEGDNFRNRLIRVFYDLQSITDQDSKEAAKEAVDAAANATSSYQGLTYTPIGYAMQAANKVLEEGGAENGEAAIILLSDGRVSGQMDGYNQALDYTSIDEASDYAASREWPIYCLELNQDSINDSDDWRGKIGRHEMRSNIPVRTSTAPVTLREPEAAETAFKGIFARFFEATSTITTASKVIEGGKASMRFSVEELVAETNLTLTGDIGAVEKIELVGPSGRPEVYAVSDGNVDEMERKVVFEGRYIIAKLMLPASGNWRVIVYGTDGVRIGLYAVSIHELTFSLRDNLPEVFEEEKGTETIAAESVAAESEAVASEAAQSDIAASEAAVSEAVESDTAVSVAVVSDTEESEDDRNIGGWNENGARILEQGTKVRFRAEYVYRDNHYQADAVYRKIPALMKVMKGRKTVAFLTMEPGNGCYQANYTFSEPGNYTVVATAQSSGFRQGQRESEILSYEVKERPEPVIESIPEPVVESVSEPVLPESSEESAAESIEESVTESIEESVAESVEESVPESTEEPAEEELVEEEPVEEEPEEPEDTPVKFTGAAISTGENTATVSKSMSIRRFGPPDFLLGLRGINASNDLTIQYSDYFSDPDNPTLEGVRFTCTPLTELPRGMTITEEDDNHAVIHVTRSTNGSFLVTAEDTTVEPAVTKTLVVEVNSSLAWSQLLQGYGVTILIILAVAAGLIVLIVVMIRNR